MRRHLYRFRQTHSLNKTSEVEPVVIWCVTTKKIASEDSFEFLCLSPAADAVQISFDEMNENAYKTKFSVLNDP